MRKLMLIQKKSVLGLFFLPCLLVVESKVCNLICSLILLCIKFVFLFITLYFLKKYIHGSRDGASTQNWR